MKYLMKVIRTGITCWPEGTDAFGPDMNPGEEKVVEYNDEIVTGRWSGLTFYVVAFEDKGKVRRFEVRTDNVELIPIAEE